MTSKQIESETTIVVIDKGNARQYAVQMPGEEVADYINQLDNGCEIILPYKDEDKQVCDSHCECLYDYEATCQIGIGQGCYHCNNIYNSDVM